MEEDNYENEIDIDHAEAMFTERDEQKVLDELLFCVQGVGSIKNINGLDVFVKDEYCEQSLKDISRFLRADSSKNPTIKKELGRWSFLEESLIPIFISQKADKKLSFYALLILAELTMMPEKDCVEIDFLTQKLKSYRT
jgi:hypothetical protein